MEANFFGISVTSKIELCRVASFLCLCLCVRVCVCVLVWIYLLLLVIHLLRLIPALIFFRLPFLILYFPLFETPILFGCGFSLYAISVSGDLSWLFLFAPCDWWIPTPTGCIFDGCLRCSQACTRRTMKSSSRGVNVRATVETSSDWNLIYLIFWK